MAYEKYTLKEFEYAWFQNDRSVIKTDEEFNQVYTEYIDTAGLFSGEEFEKTSYVYFLTGRINFIKTSIETQIKFINEFGIPYHSNIKEINSKGYSLLWKNDPEDFLDQLDKVIISENVYISELQSQSEELDIIRSKRDKENEVISNDKSSIIKKSRESFIVAKNTLGKIGFRINDNSTTVESFALMIKQQKEENESINANNIPNFV